MRKLLSAAAGALGLACAPAAYVIATATLAAATTVATEAELRAAFDSDSEVVLANDIDLVDCGEGDVDRDTATGPLVLDGQGHTIRQTCRGERVLSVNTDSDVTIKNVTITGGDATTDDGGGYQHAGTGNLSIVDSTIAGNTGCSEGGGVEVEEADAVQIIRSTLTGNRSFEESAVDLDEGGSLLVENSTVTGNIADAHGAVYGEDDPQNDGVLQLVYSDVVGNVAGPSGCVLPDAASAAEPEGADEPVAPQQIGEPANIGKNDTFHLQSFGSVVALPEGGPNCASNGEPFTDTVSDGYNYSDDDTCGFTDPTDQQNAPDPQLGALADNGGPTQTLLPAATSPLLDAIPLASCQADGAAQVTTDQRGITRPQGTGCEIGSVEIEVVVPPTPAPITVVTPTFTG